ncbi:MAG: branched-chain amino acid ABC transporter substrate-binding protein [Actinobacteria bacterium]|nr:branched-chain amino acid ABC transporter substrate-binding protein [Actinomycetota bacterium]
MNKKFSLFIRAAGIFIPVLIILFSIILALNFSACSSRERIIRIGNQAVLSGDYRSFGEEQLVSMELAISKLSPVRVGGFDYNIELVTLDDEGNPEKAFLVAQEMVEQGVVAVVGSTFDGTTKVSIPVFDEYDIPLISPFAQKTDVSGTGDNFFRMIINNKQKIDNISGFLNNEFRGGKLILIDNREEYSIELVDYLEDILADTETGVLRRYSLKVDENDLTVLAENMLIDKPDGIFFAAGYEELALLVKEVRAAGLETRFITEVMGMDDRIFVFAENADLEGLTAVIPDPPSLARYSEDPKSVSFWQDFNNLLNDSGYKDISISGPGQYAPYAYDAVFVIIESIKKSNSINSADLISEIRKTSYEGLTGHIEFDSIGDRLDPPSTVFIIKDGAWVRYN